MTLLRLCAVLLSAALLMAAGAATAADLLVPPCAGVPVPAPTLPGEAGAFVLLVDEDAATWQAPKCTGWQSAKPNLALGEAGRFVNAAGPSGILERFAAVSAFTQPKYWSTTRNSYRPLIRNAYALDKADRNARRGDFAVQDLGQGATKFVALGNTSASILVYRLTVVERTENRVTVTLENTDDAYFLVFRVLPARGAQVQLTFERDDGDVWRYYAILRISGMLRPVARFAQTSFLEPAQALLSYLAGVLPEPAEDAPGR